MFLTLHRYPTKAIYKIGGAKQVSANMLSRSLVDEADVAAFTTEQIFTIN